MADTPRDLDLIVYGATGTVGRLVAGYLAEHADPGLRVGLAGRSADRLEAVRADAGAVAADWPLVVADSTDPASVAAMCERTRVVATTVGPYARYGLPVVEACARAGTHYADITGEVLFVRECIDRFHERAQATGARIVHACGFDSIPSDLGVQVVHDRVRTDGEGELTDTTLVLRTIRGGLGGGTIDTMRNQVDAMKADPALRRQVTDPYGLSPDRAAEPDRSGGPRQRDAVGVARDNELGLWTGPFVMSPFNTRIVRRSNALLDWAYGRRFSYREVVGFGTGPAAPVLAAGVTAALGTLTAAMSFTPARAVLDRVLPDPGEGPSEKTRARGHFRFDLHAVTTTGARYAAVIAAQGDPGFAATSVMLAESALALVGDGDRLPDRAGVLTPATALDGPLTERLRARSFRFDVTRR